ncbi:PTS sugar transporter subunit IIB [Dielma fastidiosa]|uniref:PTS sugar transporter subunit IIB n=1 Tax=Dielma fastidiosa TaxID=1034346 RepID=A0AB35ULM1_9FIRM|nr:PTS sugar transporter subunit IIB [Dielma fastidiosa]MDY5168900.1 PTS sugar transporter subunit IIB [Dielma fastidiosa]
MKQILLICAQGMSTSVLVEKMKKEAFEMNYDVDITAQGLTSSLNFSAYDMILLGPQVRFRIDSVKKAAGNAIPVEIIEMADYGSMNAKKIMQHIKQVIGDSHE